MNRSLSLYLDVLRFLAALQVLFFHLPAFEFSGIERAWWNKFGHEAVVVFFVLSGYLITFAADRPNVTFRRYAISRFVRIYSVILPAIVLTLAFDIVGRSIAVEAYADFPPPERILQRFIVSATLLNQSWQLDVQVFSNTPYWSIAYEYWYYFVFGAWTLLRGRSRWVFTGIFLLIAGPKVLLLFPVWLAGCLAFRENILRTAGIGASVVAAIAIVPAWYVYINYDVLKVTATWVAGITGYDLWREGLGWSRYFVSDYYLGLFVALHFAGMKQLAPRILFFLENISSLVRNLSAYTFTLYLLHQPIIILTGAMTVPLWGGALMPWIMLSSISIIVFLVGMGTEGQRSKIVVPLSSFVDRIWPVERDGNDASLNKMDAESKASNKGSKQ